MIIFCNSKKQNFTILGENQWGNQWKAQWKNQPKSRFFKIIRTIKTIFLITVISISFCSCETLFKASNGETDLIELNIKDIFQEDSIKIPGYNYDNLTIYSVLLEMFEEPPVRFFMDSSDDNTIQEAMKEIAIIESAEKACSFSIKKYEETRVNDVRFRESAEKLFILFSSVKQLLINCVKNIDPLKEEIEQIIEEKKWDMGNQDEEEYTDLFFDIIKLENGISYLNKVKKILSRNIVEMGKIADKTEIYLNQQSN